MAKRQSDSGRDVLTLAMLCLSSAPALVSCDGGQTESAAGNKTWPAGTIFAVDDMPVFDSEIDLALWAVHLIEPGYADTHKRRLALTLLVLPRSVGRLIAGDRRQAAREEIEALHAQAQAGQLGGPPGPDGCYGESLTGSWEALGFLTWARAFELEAGQWSDVLEEVGHFQIFRVLERKDGSVPPATQFTIDVLRATYLPNPGSIEGRYDSTRLTIVDPEWLEIFPEHYLYRMGVHGS